MDRRDLFTMIHKALRHALLGLNIQAGKTDYGDLAAVAEFRTAWNQVRKSLGEHSKHEDDYIWPLLNRRAPGEADPLYEEHVEIHAFEAQLDDHFQRLLAEPDVEKRRIMGQEFYRAMQRFTARCLTHFDNEERLVLPRLWALCDDGELDAAFASIISSIDPEEMAYERSHMIEALDPVELAQLRAGMPADVG